MYIMFMYPSAPNTFLEGVSTQRQRLKIQSQKVFGAVVVMFTYDIFIYVPDVNVKLFFSIFTASNKYSSTVATLVQNSWRNLANFDSPLVNQHNDGNKPVHS